MTIRKQDDALSRVSVQESKYFDKQDKTVTSSDFNRFLYMTPGNKNKFYDWRLDWSKKNIDSTTFLIDQEKFVNRPDSISHDVYGNAKYWWIIAMANDISDPFFGFHKGRTLKIPDIELVKKELGF
mgnify:CR=1 FL=1|jgi:hypothetical protein